MELKEYLKAHDLSYDEMAQQIGVSKFAVGKWARGERIPRVAQMVRIMEYTHNRVRPDDFFQAAAESGDS